MKRSKALDRTLAKLAFALPVNLEVRQNPFSGQTALLEPEAVQLYDFITTRKWACGKDYTRAVWDNARYYFYQQWPEEYMALLD